MMKTEQQNGFRKNLWQRLANSISFRVAYNSSEIRHRISYQIRAMREERKWSQMDLAQKAGKKQSAVARWEDPDYGKFSLQTLLDIAAAYDVWLSLEFVPFSVGLQRTSDKSTSALNAISFSQDKDPATSAAKSIENLCKTPENTFDLKKNSTYPLTTADQVNGPLRPVAYC